MQRKAVPPFFSMLLLFIAVIAAVAAQGGSDYRIAAPDQPGEDENINEELWQFSKKTPYIEAMQHIALQKKERHSVSTAEVALPTGWKIVPVGRQVKVGTFPHEAVAYAGQVVVLNSGYTDRSGKEPQEVSIINPDAGEVVKILHVASLFPSAVEGKDGDLYISGGNSQKIFRFDRNFEFVREYTVSKNMAEGYAAGLAPIDRNRVAVVCMVSSANALDFGRGRYQQGKLLILNTSTGYVEKETTTGYFPYAVRFHQGKLYVTLLGENKLLVYDLQLNLIKSLETGLTPQDICAGDDSLYVVNTGSDNVSVIDTKKDSIIAAIDMQSHGKSFGSAPTSCAVDRDVLYVTQATTNSVALFDTKHRRLKGFIPAGWYPTKVLSQGKHLLVLNGKGIQARRPNVDGPQPPENRDSEYILNLLKGSLSIIPMTQISRNLDEWTRRVRDGSPVYSPLKGFKLPVRHIFYIIRENRTYDQVLGDLGKGNGDPFLTLFGKKIAPNAHKLADEFVTLDNFYANGEISVLGHSFTTSGYASPFLEWLGNAAYSGRYNGYPFGMVPSTASPSYLWDAMEGRGIDYRIYGEDYYIYTRAYRIICDVYGPDSVLAKKFYARMMSLASTRDRSAAFYQLTKPYYGQANTLDKAMRLLEKPDFIKLLSKFFCGDESLAAAIRDNAPFRRKFAQFLCRYPLNYRSWDLTHSDIERATEWKVDFDAQLESDKVAQLQYIWLPNDHTAGADKNTLAPDQFVAQNDAALGLIIETIAKSPVWKESLILVTEDDAQNGPDHVDATRTVALAAGPYVKRNALINDHYDQLSMLRTIEILLNVPPLNLNDALAIPMLSIFTEKPDTRPFLSAQAPNKLVDSDKVLYRDLTKQSKN